MRGGQGTFSALTSTLTVLLPFYLGVLCLFFVASKESNILETAIEDYIEILLCRTSPNPAGHKSYLGSPLHNLYNVVVLKGWSLN